MTVSDGCVIEGVGGGGGEEREDHNPRQAVRSWIETLKRGDKACLSNVGILTALPASA